MADARYVIDLILNARDNTQAAMASAIRNTEVLEEHFERGKQKAKEWGDSFRRSAEEISKGTKESEQAFHRLGLANDSLAKKQEALEKAARDYAKAVVDGNRSSTEQARLLKVVEDKQEDLRKSLIGTTKAWDEQGEAIRKWGRAGAESHARRIRQLQEEEVRLAHRDRMMEQAANAEIARLKKVAAEEKRTADERAKARRDLMALIERTESDIERRNTARRNAELAEVKRIEAEKEKAARERARAEAQAQRELDAERARVHRLNLQRGRDEQRVQRELARAQEESLKRIQKAATDLSRTDITPRDFDKFRRNLIEARRDFIAAGASGQQAMRAVGQALKENNATISRQHREWLQIQRDQELNIRLQGEATKRMQEYDRAVRASVEATRTLNRARELGADLDREVVTEFEIRDREARIKLEHIARDLKELDGREVNIDIDLRSAAAEAGLRRMRNETDNANSGFGRLFGTILQGFSDSGNRVAAFDNLIRGLLSLAIAAFLQQLIQLAGAAAGAFIALGSSATFAAGAIGGTLMASIAQAIPALGVLATALSRVKGVFDAVKQANLLQQQQSYQGAKAADQEANALDGVRNAQESLADAQRRLVESQRNLNVARRDSRRELEDLILAEKEAELAARGATLAHEDAQEALREAIRRGQTGQIESRQLAVDQAALGRRRAGTRLGRAREDLAGGAGEGVRRAEEQVRDAERAVERARRGLDRARRTSAQAEANITAAAGKLAFLLGQMSAAERRLYEAIAGPGGLQEVWGRFSRTAAEPLINSFTFAVRRITGLLQQPRILAAARSLSQGMATQFRRAFSALTSNEAVSQWLRIAAQARRNLAPLTDIVISLSRSFMDIAEAAGPAFRRIILWVRTLTLRFESLISTSKRSGDLGRFFQQGVTHLQAWVRFLGSIGRLFLAIAGPGGGAATGLDLLNKWTRGINNFARAVGTEGTKANRFFRTFFEQTKRILSALGPVFTSLAREFDLTFNKAGTGAIEGFANFMADVLIPGLGKFIRTMGQVTSAVGNFVSQHPRVAAILSTLLGLGLVGAIVGKFASLFSGPVKAIAALAGAAGKATGITNRLRASLRAAGGSAGIMSRAFAVLTGPIGLVTAAIVGLLANAGVLDDVWRALRRAGVSVWRQIRRGVRNLMGAVEELIAAFRGRDGLGPVLRHVGRVLADILIPTIRLAGRIVGNSLKVAFDVLAGVIRVIARLLRGDVSGAFRALGDIGKSVLEAMKSNFRGLISFFGDLGKRLVNRLLDAFTGIGKKIKDKITSVDITPWDGLIPGKAMGGRIGSGYGGGDRVPILAEEGEWVIRKEAVKHWGEDTMRRINLGSGGGRRGGYQAGGRVQATGAAAQVSTEQMDEYVRLWRQMWEQITTSTRRNTNRVEAQFREMRVGIERTMNRLSREFHERWRRMSSYMHARLRNMVRGTSISMGRMQTVVYEGMRYIGGATNKALKAFDADPVRLSLEAPRGTRGGGGDGETRAATGYIGQPGERGRDAIWALVGRGEAVLNHWQQRAINSMLPGGMSVADIVRRTRGYHAGGMEQPGFAGGYAGKIPGNGRAVPIPGAPGEFIAKRILGGVQKMMRRYKMAVTDGFATSGHSTNSDHYKGLAVDFVPGAGGNWNLVDQAAAYARTKLGSVFRWIGYDGVPGHGRGHHLHLSWLSDAKGLGAAVLEEIKRAKVGGTPGPLRKLAQKMIDKARNAANKLLEGQMDSGEMEAHPTGAVLGRGDVMNIINRAMDIVGVPGSLRSQWRSMAYDRARQESGFNPNAVNNWDINAQRGDPSKGLFQTISATFRAYMSRGMNNILNPLHNAVAAFNYMFSRYGGGESWGRALQRMLGLRGVGYATGGIIPGDYEGAPQPILAHAGEWILNRGQQEKIAGLMGTSRDKVRAALGFSGGPTEFANGGVVGHERRRFRRINRGIYEDPMTFGLDFGDELVESRRLFRALANNARRMRRKVVSFNRGLSRFVNNIEELTEENGILERMAQNLETGISRRRTGIALLRQGIRRVGGVRGRLQFGVRRLTEEETAERELDVNRAERRGLRQIRGAAQEGLEQTEEQIRRMRRAGRGRIREQDEKRYQRLMSARSKFVQTIDETDQKIAENMEARWELRIQRFQASTNQMLSGLRREERVADVFIRAGEMMGVTGESMTNLQKARLESQKKQLAILQQRVAQASQAGFTEEAASLQEQVEDLSLTIIEATQAMLQASIDAVNSAAERAERARGLSERRAALTEGLGNRVGAAEQRLAIARQEGTDITTQRNALAKILADQMKLPEVEQNSSVIQSLTDQIEELDLALKENTLAQRDAANAVRQARIDNITRRGEFQGGVFGALSGIMGLVNAATGNQDVGRMLQIAQAQGGTLRETGRNLRSELAAMGLDLADLSGQALVDKLLTTDFDALTAGMTEAERQTFESLVNAVLANESALLDNTNAINELNGTMQPAQTFTSSAWRLFRQAIFTGSGGLMPQYQIPSAQTGGYVTRGGLFNLHAGEFIVNPDRSNLPPMQEGDTNVHVHMVRERADPMEIAARTMWERRRAGRR